MNENVFPRLFNAVNASCLQIGNLMLGIKN